MFKVGDKVRVRNNYTFSPHDFIMRGKKGTVIVSNQSECGVAFRGFKSGHGLGVSRRCDGWFINNEYLELDVQSPFYRAVMDYIDKELPKD